jgi:hypothetical protein
MPLDGAVTQFHLHDKLVERKSTLERDENEATDFLRTSFGSRGCR